MCCIWAIHGVFQRLVKICSGTWQWVQMIGMFRVFQIYTLRTPDDMYRNLPLKWIIRYSSAPTSMKRVSVKRTKDILERFIGQASKSCPWLKQTDLGILGRRAPDVTGHRSTSTLNLLAFGKIWFLPFCLHHLRYHGQSSGKWPAGAHVAQAMHSHKTNYVLKDDPDTCWTCKDSVVFSFTIYGFQVGWVSTSLLWIMPSFFDRIVCIWDRVPVDYHIAHACMHAQARKHSLAHTTLISIQTYKYSICVYLSLFGVRHK
jgi:hypothetical protein